jgi:hypothetical protein
MDTFHYDQFNARAKVFDIAPKFYFYDPQGNVIAFLKQKLFKLKEDIRLYSDDSATQELLLIKARNYFDIATTYDVTDAGSGQRIGALKRKGLKSMLRDEWQFLDMNDTEVGLIQEDSTGKAIARRLLGDWGWLFPQTFNFVVDGQTVGTAKQNFNPFVRKLDIDVSGDMGKRLDRRLIAAATVLLLAIEGKQG